jgi:thiol-disulfide isomerase/thioredoxin
MRRLFWTAALALAIVSAAWAVQTSHNKTEKPGVTPKGVEEASGEYQQLLKDYEAASTRLKKAFDDAKSEKDQEKIIAEYRKLGPSFAVRFLKFAQKFPTAPNAPDALAFILQTAPFCPEADKAADVLSTKHAGNEGLVRQGSTFAYAPTAGIEKVLRATLKAQTGDVNLALASANLGQFLVNKAQAAQLTQDADGDLYKRIEEIYTKELAKDLKAADIANVEGEAARLFDNVVNKYGKAKGLDQKVLAASRAHLYVLQNLSVGKVAPEIDGEGVDGKKFKLSQYRGKVVVVSFWATWCAPCLALVPHERDLVKKYKDKPFAFLSVNSDKKTSRDKVKETVKDKQMTWPCWLDGDGGEEGPIAQKYRVKEWPTVYVLDTKGVIRAKNVRDKKLDEVIEKLVKEAAGRH